ncbi:MAG TPA: hypothetical protein VI792_03235 [Candidatus Eisenbacteria bacterium]
MSPEERAKLVQGISDAYAGAVPDEEALQGPAVVEPRVPPQRAPDVPFAERRLEDAASERYALSDTAHAPLRAQDTVQGVEGKPLPTTTSWADQVARSFLPQVVTRDERPASAEETAEANLANLPRTAAEVALGPIVDPRFREFAKELADPSRDTLTPEPEMGTPTENGVLYLMRLLGTVAPAIVGETVERAPAPDVAGAASAYAQQQGAAEIARRFFTPSTVGQQVLGYDPNDELRVNRGSAVGNWAQGTLERIERGQAFEEDMRRAFKARLGSDWENTGWWLGLGLDMFGDWEGNLAKALGAPAKIARSADALGALIPEGLRSERSLLWDAIKGNELQSARWMADRQAPDLLSGAMDPDQLPDKARQFVEEVSQNDYGASFRDLLAADQQEQAGPLQRFPPTESAGPRPSPGPTAAELRAQIADLEQQHAANVSAAQAQHAGKQGLVSFVQGAQELRARDFEAQAEELERNAQALDFTAEALRTQLPEPELSTASQRANPVPSGPVYKTAAEARAGAKAEREAAKAARLEKREARTLAKERGAGAKSPENKAIAAQLPRPKRVKESGRFHLPEGSGTERRVVGSIPREETLNPGAVQDQLERSRAAADEAAAMREQAEVLRERARHTRYLSPREEPFVPPAEPGELAGARATLARIERLEVPQNAREARAVLTSGDQGAGFRQLGDALEQSVDDPKYLVRDRAGTLVDEGRLADVLPIATRKPERGLEVWYGTQRPVARWGPSGFKADHLFASDVERAVIDHIRAADPGLSTSVPDLPPKPLSPQEIVGQTVADFVSGAPPPGPQGSTPLGGRAAAALRKGYALAVRDTIGADRLKQLPGVFTMVAREDHGPILEQAAKLRGGLTAERAAQVIRGDAELTDAERAAWSRLLPGVDLTHPTIRDWNDAYHNSIKEAGGFLSDARYRIQGNPSYADRILLMLKDPHIRERVGFELKKRGPVGFLAHQLVQGFTADALARLPESARVAVKELRTAVQTEIGALMRAIRRGGRPVEDILRDAVTDLRLPHPDEIDRAKWIQQGHRLDYHIEQLRNRWVGVRPSWLDTHDPVAAAGGLKGWAEATFARQRHIAQDWILTHLALDGADVGETGDLAARVRKLQPDTLERVYNEFVRRGDPNGPELAAVLAGFGHKPADPMSALAQWTIAARAKSVAGQVLDQLVFEGIGVRASDPRIPALRAVLTGEHRVWNEAAQRWHHLYTDAEVTWATRMLKGWAIEPGMGTSSTLKAVAGSDVLIPRFLADEANRLIKVGTFRGSAELTPYKLLNNLYILWKQVATHGFIVPNAAHFVGQMVGLVPTLVTTVGYKGAASALGTLLWSDAALTGELVKRVGGRSWPTFQPRAWEGVVLRAGDLLYGIDELEDVARRIGLGETRPDFEVANQIAELLQGEPGNGPLAWNKLRQGLAWWQELLQSTAGAFDLHGRIAVYLDGVKQGLPLEQAAVRARDAMLDFRELTPFEATYMRLVFTFYAYMRKSADAMVRAAIRDPARVASQARLAYQGLQGTGLAGVQLGALSDSDVSRLIAYSDRDVTDKNGRPNRLYDRNWVTSAPIGVGEALGTLRMLLPLPRLGLDWRGDLQSLNPGAQALAVAALGRRLDRDIDRPWMNKVPPFLMDIPVIGKWLGDALGIGPEPLTKFDDPLLADDDASDAAGVPAYWAAGTRYDTTTPAEQEAQRRAWQEVALFLGRPFSTIEGVAEGIGLERAPPYVTQGEAAFDALLGFKHRPVLTQEESVRRFELRRESALRDAANQVRPPEGIGPR